MANLARRPLEVRRPPHYALRPRRCAGVSVKLQTLERSSCKATMHAQGVGRPYRQHAHRLPAWQGKARHVLPGIKVTTALTPPVNVLIVFPLAEGLAGLGFPPRTDARFSLRPTSLVGFFVFVAGAILDIHLHPASQGLPPDIAAHALPTLTQSETTHPPPSSAPGAGAGRRLSAGRRAGTGAPCGRRPRG
jgi:hypothetical protein